VTREQTRAFVAGDSDCPDAERLAEYAENRLSGASRAALERHLAGCMDCRTVVAETVAFLGHDRGQRPKGGRILPFRAGWVSSAAVALGAAAALVLVVRVLPPYWTSQGAGPEFEALVAAVSREPTRPAEGRLTGGFAYAPARRTTRSALPKDTENLALLAAAAELQQTIEADPSPDNRHALGVALLLLGDHDRSIDILAVLPRESASQARYVADLGAAYLARAIATGDVEDFARARSAVDSALSLDPGLPEAWFTKAVISERTSDRQGAVAAWDRYLALDPDSEWAGEARERRDRLL
jgi:tetratricopeptide (TPR) repeat protein